MGWEVDLLFSLLVELVEYLLVVTQHFLNPIGSSGYYSSPKARRVPHRVANLRGVGPNRLYHTIVEIDQCNSDSKRSGGFRARSLHLMIYNFSSFKIGSVVK